MKRHSFILLVIVLNLSFVFLQIYKYSQWAQETYFKQQQEKRKGELVKKRELLLKELCTLKDPVIIKKYAAEKLGMQKIRLNQVKSIQVNHEQS